MSDFKIEQGSLDNPYKEFTFTIAAGAIEQVYYAFDYVRCLTFTGANTDIKLRFGKSGSESDFIGAGIGIKMPYVVESLAIRNASASPITVTFALAIGIINDDRLNVSGTITTNSANIKVEDSAAASGDSGDFILGVRNSAKADVTSATGDYSQISVDQKGAVLNNPSNSTIVTAQTTVSTSPVLLVAASATNGEILIKAGSSDLYLGGTNAVTISNGFLVESGQAVGLNGNMGDIYGVRASGSATAYSLRGVN